VRSTYEISVPKSQGTDNSEDFSIVERKILRETKGNWIHMTQDKVEW
jgi:hypothetical protein